MLVKKHKKTYNKLEDTTSDLLFWRQIMELYETLKYRYGENQPIFVSDICIDGYSQNNIRQQVMRLSDSGKLARYDTGIYYIPKKSFLNIDLPLSASKVIEAKYISNGKEIIGYYSGLQFANRIGITSQVPMVSQVVSNKATNDSRLVKVGDFSVKVKKPKIKITNQNYKAMQFLDLISEIEKISELEGKELTSKLFDYMSEANLSFFDLQPLFQYYPDRLYKNFYMTGLMELRNELSA